MGPQTTLTLIAGGVGTVGFLCAVVYLIHYTPKHDRDWVEVLARGAFVWLQCTIWGTVIGFIVMEEFFGVNFGGTK